MGLTVLPLHIGGNLGNIAGAGSDGVLSGILTAEAVSYAATQVHALPVLCATDDGGTYVDDTTDANDAGADDVTVLPAVPVAGDAFYIGHGTLTFAQVDGLVGQQGVNDHEGTWQYWDGDSWEDLTTVVDGFATSGDAFTATAALHSLTYDLPGDWARCTVDNKLGYWIRLNIDTVTAQTTACLMTQFWVVVAAADATYADVTAYLNSAAANDVAPVPAHPAVGDAIYVGSALKFCKVYFDQDTAGVATWTVVAEYWNGSAWGAITTYEDDTAGWTTGTSNYYLHFVPPTDWVANTAGNGPNGEAGFFIRMRISAFTSLTTQPLLTQSWVLPLVTAAVGMGVGATGTITEVNSSAQTVSASNADSVFLLLNTTSGAFISFTWTKAVAADSTSALSLAVTANDEVALVQVIEDGTTELADANFWFDLDT